MLLEHELLSALVLEAGGAACAARVLRTCRLGVERSRAAALWVLGDDDDDDFGETAALIVDAWAHLEVAGSCRAAGDVAAHCVVADCHHQGRPWRMWHCPACGARAKSRTDTRATPTQNPEGWGDWTGVHGDLRVNTGTTDNLAEK